MITLCWFVLGWYSKLMSPVVSAQQFKHFNIMLSYIRIQNGWLCDERWNPLHRSNFIAINVVIVTLPAYSIHWSFLFFISSFVVVPIFFVCFYHQNISEYSLQIVNAISQSQWQKWAIFSLFHFLPIVKFHFQLNSF